MTTAPWRALKWASVALLGLLFLAWLVSWNLGVRAFLPTLNHRLVTLDVHRGSIAVRVNELPGYWGYTWDNYPPHLPKDSMLGQFYLRNSAKRFTLVVPVPLLFALLLPIAIGSFISFRHRLWHYLAYTALLALGFAYYLRWQK